MTTPKIDCQTRLVTALSLVMGPMVLQLQNTAGKPAVHATLSVAGKTYTTEELEHMAAIRAAQACDLPNEFLLKLAEKYPPPAEWLDAEEEMPF